MSRSSLLALLPLSLALLGTALGGTAERLDMADATVDAADADDPAETGDWWVEGTQPDWWVGDPDYPSFDDAPSDTSGDTGAFDTGLADDTGALDDTGVFNAPEEAEKKIPQDVLDIFKKRCGGCHTTKQQKNAPAPRKNEPLDEWDPKKGGFPWKDKKPDEVIESIKDRINRDDNKIMPRAPGKPLTDEEKKKINDWIEQIQK